MNATEFCPLTETAVRNLLTGRELKLPDATSYARRRESRWPFPGTVELWVPDEAAVERYVLGTCLNLGMSGLGISCDEQLPVGMVLGLAVHQPEVSMHGRAVVRHCTGIPDGYFIGLEFVFPERRKAPRRRVRQS